MAQATALREGDHDESTYSHAIPEMMIHRRQERARRRAREFIATHFTILVMEGDDSLRSTLNELLRSAGFRVVAAASASRGCELLVHRYIDLVVCGMHLPDGSGPEIVRSLKQMRCLPSHQSIPTILIAPEDHDLTSAALRSGADLVCLRERVANMLIPQVLFLVQ